MISTERDFALCGKGDAAESAGSSQGGAFGCDDNIGATVTYGCCAIRYFDFGHGV